MKYAEGQYRQSIQYSIAKLNRERTKENLPPIPRWSPNQIRHSVATLVRQRFGLEAAQVTLGHAAADVTQIYAERDSQLAIEVARQIG